MGELTKARFHIATLVPQNVTKIANMTKKKKNGGALPQHSVPAFKYILQSQEKQSTTTSLKKLYEWLPFDTTQ